MPNTKYTFIKYPKDFSNFAKSGHTALDWPRAQIRQKSEPMKATKKERKVWIRVPRYVELMSARVLDWEKELEKVEQWVRQTERESVWLDVENKTQP